MSGTIHVDKITALKYNNQSFYCLELSRLAHKNLFYERNYIGQKDDYLFVGGSYAACVANCIMREQPLKEFNNTDYDIYSLRNSNVYAQTLPYKYQNKEIQFIHTIPAEKHIDWKTIFAKENKPISQVFSNDLLTDTLQTYKEINNFDVRINRTASKIENALKILYTYDFHNNQALYWHCDDIKEKAIMLVSTKLTQNHLCLTERQAAWYNFYINHKGFQYHCEKYAQKLGTHLIIVAYRFMKYATEKPSLSKTFSNNHKKLIKTTLQLMIDKGIKEPLLAGELPPPDSGFGSQIPYIESKLINYYELKVKKQQTNYHNDEICF